MCLIRIKIDFELNLILLECQCFPFCKKFQTFHSIKDCSASMSLLYWSIEIMNRTNQKYATFMHNAYASKRTVLNLKEEEG